MPRVYPADFNQRIWRVVRVSSWPGNKPIAFRVTTRTLPRFTQYIAAATRSRSANPRSIFWRFRGEDGQIQVECTLVACNLTREEAEIRKGEAIRDESPSGQKPLARRASFRRPHP